MSLSLDRCRPSVAGIVGPCLFMVALLSSGCLSEATETAGVGFERDPIIDGVAERGYLGVGALLIDEGAGASLCTGTAIADNWVLTAAHCVAGHDWYDVTFFSGHDVTLPTTGDYYTAGALIVHPRYRALDSRHDIALVYVAGLDDVPTYEINTSATPPTRGLDVYWVGYGLNQTRPSEDGDGTKRMGTGDIDAVNTATLIYDVEAGEAMPCRGDSGGPMFADMGGTERIVGIVSTGDRYCEERGTDRRVDYYTDTFIADEMATGAPDNCDVTAGECGSDACWYAGGEEFYCFPTNGIALGAVCDPIDIESSWPTVTCEDGATCIRTSDTDPTVGECIAFCHVDGDCADGETCDIPVFRGVTDVGICIPEGLEECEDIRGGDCSPGTACWPAISGGLLCFPSEEIGLDGDCNSDQSGWDELPCDDGMICMGPGSDGSCYQFCFDETDCRDGEECHTRLFDAPNDDIGYCGPCEDMDSDGYCADDDCDDDDASANPGETERCGDEVDNNCDGDVDEGCEECTDDDGDGYCDTDDCDDGDDAVNPGADEECEDGVDNDCDGATDDDDTDCGGEGPPDGGPDDPDADTGDPDGGPDDPPSGTGGEGCGCAATGSAQGASATFMTLILALWWLGARSRRR